VTVYYWRSDLPTLVASLQFLTGLAGALNPLRLADDFV
jgi:hypothetical protein